MSRGKAAERRERILHTDSPSCGDPRSNTFSTLPTLPASLVFGGDMHGRLPKAIETDAKERRGSSPRR